MRSNELPRQSAQWSTKWGDLERNGEENSQNGIGLHEKVVRKMSATFAHIGTKLALWGYFNQVFGDISMQKNRFFA